MGYLVSNSNSKGYLITKLIAAGYQVINIAIEWILETGSWNDFGDWVDSALWNDG
jgi:hypothetical protein